MEVFYSRNIQGYSIILDEAESSHCVRVMRHREGDQIFVIDGEGTLYSCTLEDASPKAARARITGIEKDWGVHPYRLTMAVCPTKNADRYEWFAEKATEMGLDLIVPVIGERSERKVFKPERLARVLLSASKQSLKGAVPEVAESISVKDFIQSSDPESLRMICCCFEGSAPRRSVENVLGENPVAGRNISILIGPEGDFSREEVELALERGFIPVHLGPSRLRTETAALVAVCAVYLASLRAS